MSGRTISIALLIGLAAVALATAVLADDTKPVRVAGELTKIDGKSLTITTGTGADAKSTVVTCNAATKISWDNKPGVPAKFKDLKVGQQVRAYCNQADNVALHVHIAKAAASNPGK